MSESQSRRDIEYQVGTTTCINAMIIRINDKSSLKNFFTQVQ
jgi:hypothetical protein